jgi:hypothetical protein
VFHTSLSRWWSYFQNKFLSLSEPVSIPKMMVTTKACNLSHGSFLRSQYSAAALLNSRSFSRRYGILLLCLSIAGTWTTMLGILMAWQVSGEVIVSLSVILFLFLRVRNRSQEPFRMLLSFGVFLISLRWLLEKQSILMSVLGESDFHFMLADGRFPAQILWLTVTFVLTVVLGIESWAIFMALVLFVAGSLSLNGAVAFIVGEMLAHVWVLWWRSRKMNQDVRRLTQNYALVNTMGLVIAFVIAGLLRDAFTFNLEENILSERSGAFFVMYFLIVVVQCLAALVWGHFAARKKLDEVQRGEYFPVSWISQNLISNGILDFILKKLNQRLDLLLTQQKELDSKERAQIPAAFLNQHEHEITQLALWLPLVAEARNKR